MTLAFVFPGQGSQYVGMGQEIAQNYPEARKVFAQAEKILGGELTRLAFHGPAEELKLTVNTQPAVFTTSVACFEVLSSHGILPGFVAGHSLGEYSALVAANAVGFEETVDLVCARGVYMETAYPAGQGGMVAILGLEPEKVAVVCRTAAEKGTVEPANYNCPGQVVIAGERLALEYACGLAKEAGARRTLWLSVSGPFHCSLIGGAAEKLRDRLASMTVGDPVIPVVANATADYVRTGLQIKDALVRQVQSPVRWDDSIKRLIADGVTDFVEVGPGSVLSGLIRKIDNSVRTFSVEDMKSLEKTLASLREGG